MNAFWTILLAVLMAASHLTRVGIAVPAALRSPGQSQMAQAGDFGAGNIGEQSERSIAAESQPCPCYVPHPCPCDVQQPCGNVAPWSWQHDNQNDDEWPADHGG